MPVYTYLVDRNDFTGYPKNVALEGQVLYSGGQSVEDYLTANFGTEAMTEDDFMAYQQAWQDAHYLSDPAAVIDELAFDEALEVLPPLRYTRENGMVSFLMSEFTTGSITTMYAKCYGVCLCKAVDVRRKDTWISPADFDKHRLPTEGYCE